MSYRNKTYVIFDGDNDMWAYRFMRGWAASEHIAFDFHDAHELNNITEMANEQTTKTKLCARFSSAKQAIVLIGDSTRYLYKFVRWEIEMCQALALPVVCVNLNKSRDYHDETCPPILRNSDAVHVSYNAKIIRFALDDFCANYRLYSGKGNNWTYGADTYRGLGL